MVQETREEDRVPGWSGKGGRGREESGSSGVGHRLAVCHGLRVLDRAASEGAMCSNSQGSHSSNSAYHGVLSMASSFVLSWKRARWSGSKPITCKHKRVNVKTS